MPETTVLRSSTSGRETCCRLKASNWPVSERAASYAALLGIVRVFFERKGPAAAARFFRHNAEKAYGVTLRDA